MVQFHKLIKNYIKSIIQCYALNILSTLLYIKSYLKTIISLIYIIIYYIGILSIYISGKAVFTVYLAQKYIIGRVGTG